MKSSFANLKSKRTLAGIAFRAFSLIYLASIWLGLISMILVVANGNPIYTTIMYSCAAIFAAPIGILITYAILKWIITGDT